MKTPLYAAGISVIVSADAEVFVEMRDKAGAVIAVAGLKICAAVDFNEQVSSACHRVLAGPAASGAVH